MPWKLNMIFFAQVLFTWYNRSTPSQHYQDAKISRVPITPRKQGETPGKIFPCVNTRECSHGSVEAFPTWIPGYQEGSAQESSRHPGWLEQHGRKIQRSGCSTERKRQRNTSRVLVLLQHPGCFSTTAQHSSRVLTTPRKFLAYSLPSPR